MTIKILYKTTGRYKADLSSTSTYYPFGMLMPERNWSSEWYRYGFGGKFEKDDEVNGEGNFLDWGGFGYDSRLVRRWSVDLLHSKYPWFTPYSPVSNSPILYKEIDGKDYAVYINHTDKTILIKATFYTKKGEIDTKNSALIASQFWNGQSGEFQYKVKDGNKTIFYDINFQLHVEEVDDPKTQVNIDNRPEFLMGKEDSKLITDGSSNVYALVPDADLESNVNGRTDGGNSIRVKESKKEGGTGAHEEGHIFNFGHMDYSIMSKYGNVNRENSINTTIVNQILNNAAGIGYFNYNTSQKESANGNLQPSEGKEPKGFKEGEVIRAPKNE